MYNSPVIHWGKNFIEKFNLQNCKNVLDIGCRNGELTTYLARQYRQNYFTAIDNCSEKISIAKENQLSNLNFFSTDALSLDYSQYFDAIVSFSCLHWIKNKFSILQNIYRCLKPGGKAYLQFFGYHGRPKNDRFLYQTSYLPSWKHYFKEFEPNYTEITIGALGHLLQSIGFIIHKIEIVKYQTIFEHADLLQAWLKTWASHCEQIPKAKQEHFLIETVKAYLNNYHLNSNKAFSYFEYLFEVICEKPIDNYLVPHRSCRYGSLVFTRCEILVLKHFLQGKSAKEMGSLLSVSAKTIEFHLANIKKKLNCHRRSEVVRAAIAQGFIELILD